MAKNYDKKKPDIDLHKLVQGKIPPQAIKVEKFLLGSLLRDRECLGDVQDILTPDKFYLQSHQLIYQTILSLDLRGKGFDILIVVEELTRMGKLEEAGGAYYVTTLNTDVQSTALVRIHALEIVEKWIKRSLIRAGGEMIRDGFEEGMDPFELLNQAEKSLSDISNSNDRAKIYTADTVLAKTMTQIEARMHSGTGITGVPSGLESLDKITMGWQPTDLIILAARPSMGKTAFALNLATNAVLLPRPVPVAFFSLEMSSTQLMERILSGESEIHFEKIRSGRLEGAELKNLYQHAVDRIAKAPLFIDDTPALNIFELRAKCRRLKAKNKIELIIIDYLQLMSGTGEKNGSREQEISQISRALKGLAKELQVPVIALSQLSRAVETRNEKTPQLSDLRESGAIEQDADTVMFLYRPEYYGINTNEMGESSKGETHVKIAKHRNGSLETIKFRALLHIQKFIEWDGVISFTPPPVPSNFRPAQNYYEPKGEDPFPI